MWVYRIGRTSWKEKKTNKEVLKTFKMKKELPREIKVRQIKYFGHIKRHDTLLKILLEGKVKGRRARGRQRYKSVNNITRWTVYSLVEYTTKTRDRGCWRSVAANLRCGDGTL